MEFATHFFQSVARVFRSSASAANRLPGRRHLLSAGTFTVECLTSARTRSRRDSASTFAHVYVFTWLCALLLVLPARLHADTATLRQAADRALAWLAESQNADGSWGGGVVRFLLTSEAADTFRAHHRRNETYRRAITWLEGHIPSNHDFAARRAGSLVPNGNHLASELEAIAQGKNDADLGLTGWGLYPNLNASTLDTVEVFDAYLEYGDATGAAEAVDWLIGNHLLTPQGGWAAIAGGEADPLATARVIVAGQKVAGRYPDLDTQFPNAVTIVESLAESSNVSGEHAMALRALLSMGASSPATTETPDSLA